MSKSSSSSAALAATPGPRPPVPDSEVIARPRWRSFTAEYRRSILDQADAAQDAGAVGLLLRREGLYSSHLATWRRQRKQGGIDALTPKKRGPKVVVSPLVKQNREQQATIARLTKKLKNAELIIEVQKKWRRYWATRFRTSRSTRRTDERRLGTG
jgi:transposase-like protein